MNNVKNLSQPLNFYAGLFLITLSMFFIFSREAFVIGSSLQLDSFFLILAAVLSIGAALSQSWKTVFGINLFLGLLFMGSFIFIISLRTLNYDWLMANIYDYTGGDAFFHALLGLFYGLNAISFWSNTHGQIPTRNSKNGPTVK